MLLGRFMVACSLMAGLSVVARADLTPVDPEIAIDIGSDSTAIGPGVPFYSDTTIGGGGVTQFYNPNSGFITELVFQVPVNNGTFNCYNDGSDGTFGGFFLGCSALYNSQNGILTITFSGVNPPDEDSGCDTEVGEHEGIPPLQAGCTGRGQFGVDLNDVIVVNNQNVHLTNGSWNNVSNPPNSQLTFITTNVQANGVDVAPEPSTLLPLAGGFLLIGILARRRWRPGAQSAR